MQYEVKEAKNVFYRDQQHSHWGINLLSYEKSMNEKVRMTVAIPVEKGSWIDGSAYQHIYEMSFKCVNREKRFGNLKGFIDKCKTDVSIDTYLKANF